MAEVELDGRVVGPLETVHTELRAKESIGSRQTVLVRRTQHQQRAVAQEDEFAARTQQARRFRNPAVRVSPDGRAVLADDDVEGPVARGTCSPAARTSGNRRLNSS